MLLLDLVSKGAFVAELHKNVEIVMTETLDWNDLDQVGMVGQVFEDLYLLVEDLFGLWAVGGDYFDGKFLKLPRLFIGPLYGTERSSANLLVI